MKKSSLVMALAAAVAFTGYDIDKELPKQYRPPEKEKQSEEEKNMKLQKAEEKRKRKLEKKNVSKRK